MTTFELPREDHFEFLKDTFNIGEKEIFLCPVTPNKSPIYNLVIRASKGIIGIQRMYLNSKSLHLSYIKIKPELRGLGFGKTLLEETIRFAKDNNINKITTNTREKNTSIMKMFADLGFSRERASENYSNGDSKIHHWYETNSCS